MLSVFILCAGDGARWNNYLGVPKQLITFGNETLLGRTSRLVTAERPAALYCVTRDPRISLPTYPTVYISHTDSLPETILGTRQYWSARNVFLLGDVFFSQQAVSLILDCVQDLAFFGRPWPSSLVNCGHGEMFGLTFDAHLDPMPLLARGLSLTNQGVQTNLWNLYQLAAGLPLGSSDYVRQLLVPIDDYTNDIDTPNDYWRRNLLYERISEGDRTLALA